LAILKAGAAYVPLDPSYPSERLAYMLEDAAPRMVLTQQRLTATLPEPRPELIELEEVTREIGGYPSSNFSSEETGARAPYRVYVIYTSGSTGRPKGTEMAHRSMVNLIEWHRQSYVDNERKRVLQFAALSFDVSFQETFTTLCTGGTLVLLDEWVRRDVRALAELLSRHEINRLFLPPLMLQRLAEFVLSADACLGHLEDVITAGEQLRVTAEIVGLFKRLGGARLHNHYGPTESHVVTSLSLTGDPKSWPALPTIGRPIANTQLYVLDESGQPVRAGATGEIYIGGANVACGYLNKPQLTAERFIPDPFGSHPGARLYKSGDLGRWRPDGTLEYLGRNDDQVKIRGFRVELAEIEAQLARHPHVKDAAVVARPDEAGNKRLVAYVTPRAQPKPAPEVLRTFLQATLPDYMIPSAFVVLERLPLTPSGKLDRRTLPAPEHAAYVSRPYTAPASDTEILLAGLWQELLQVDRVGREDHFFELGGDSVAAMHLVARLRSDMSIEMPMSVLFEHPTIAQLSPRVEKLREAGRGAGLASESDVADLLERVTSMSDAEVQVLLRKMTI
jgi:amino acid adenylation domain-containing protein